jgi:hypothetical protein
LSITDKSIFLSQGALWVTTDKRALNTGRHPWGGRVRHHQRPGATSRRHRQPSGSTVVSSNSSIINVPGAHRRPTTATRRRWQAAERSPVFRPTRPGVEFGLLIGPTLRVVRGRPDDPEPLPFFSLVRHILKRRLQIKHRGECAKLMTLITTISLFPHYVVTPCQHPMPKPELVY